MNSALCKHCESVPAAIGAWDGQPILFCSEECINCCGARCIHVQALIARLRDSLTQMHRRAQSAERGLTARIEPGDRTLGRALANSAAVMRRAQLFALSDAVRAYIHEYGLEHEDDCPEDDTCACPLVVAIEAALAAAETCR